MPQNDETHWPQLRFASGGWNKIENIPQNGGLMVIYHAKFRKKP